MEPVFAYLHFASIFGLAALLAAEFFLCNEDLQPGHVRLLARIDRAYLLAVVAVLATGVIRVFWSPNGPAFYSANPVFHFKLALFFAVGMIAVAPTLQFLRWGRALNEGRVRVLSGADITRVRRLIGLELLLLALLPLAAVLMARGISPLS